MLSLYEHMPSRIPLGYTLLMVVGMAGMYATESEHIRGVLIRVIHYQHL